MKINNKPKKFNYELIDGSYNHDDEYWNEDLYSCLENNKLEKIKPEKIVEIVAEVTGENDHYDWWWIVRLDNKQYGLIAGGCDYTGWDCRSSINHESVHKTAENAAKKAPTKEEYSNRNIQKHLLNQLNNTEVFGTWGENNR